MKYTRQIIFTMCVVILCGIIFAGRVQNVSAVKSESAFKLPIIMYHQVSEKPKKLGKYVISPAEFEHDVKLALARGFTPITVNDLIAHADGVKKLPPKPIIFSFDDGCQSDYVYVFGIAKKYGIRIVSSPVGAYTEEYSGDVPRPVDYAHLSTGEMREMQESGLFEFQNHSYNMHNFDINRKGCLKRKGESEKSYDALIRADFERAQKIFRDSGLPEPTCFTYPFGSTNETLLTHVKTFGFRASLGTYERVNVLTGAQDELYDLKRFNRPHGMDIKKILSQAE
ncbi:MAG: polysaccharide deacetylase family protein [Clostridia bacterium]